MELSHCLAMSTVATSVALDVGWILERSAHLPDEPLHPTRVFRISVGPTQRVLTRDVQGQTGDASKPRDHAEQLVSIELRACPDIKRVQRWGHTPDELAARGGKLCAVASSPPLTRVSQE